MIDTTTWRRARWQTDQRYYEAHLHQDLWGGWVLTKVWGGRGSRRGGMQSIPILSPEAGLSEMTRLAKRRQQRGYMRLPMPEGDKSTASARHEPAS